MSDSRIRPSVVSTVKVVAASVAILIGTVQETENVRAVVDERRRLDEADEFRRGLGALDGMPRRERARDRRLELLRGDERRRPCS